MIHNNSTAAALPGSHPRMRCRTAAALAVLGAAAGTAAQAQSNVTVYGVLDATAEYVQAKGATPPGTDIPSRKRLSSNSSLLGFRGQEDVGNGWSAIFQIEGGLNVSNGAASSFANRDTFVGLTGPSGTLKAGYITSPLRGLGGRLNWLPGSTSISNNIGVFTTLNGQQLGLNSRAPNAVMYTSPSWNGVEASALYAFAQNQNDTARGVGLKVDRGQFWFGYAYESRLNQAKLAKGSSNDWEHRAVLRYMPGDTKFSLGWDRHGSDGTYGSGAAAGDGGIRRDAVGLAVSQTVGAHEFIAHYVKALNLHCSGAANTGQCAPANVGSTSASQWALTYHYWFSKRTMLQAFATRISNARYARYDFDVNPVSADFASRPFGTAPTGVGLGVRHTF